MEKSKASKRYSPEMRARGVRMVLEHQGSYETQSAAVAAIAPSGDYARLAVRADPSKASARQQRHAVLLPKIKKVWNDNWRQLCREGEVRRAAP